MRRDAFQAIADPTRREILHLLTTGPLNYHTVAENFSVSRTAVAKHIRILTECGLVTVRHEGREKLCTARFEKLEEVSDWIDQYRIFWNQKLDHLEQFLSKTRPVKSTSHQSKKHKK
jgi:DNA-binding transcriptional ArsR family regulator